MEKSFDKKGKYIPGQRIPEMIDKKYYTPIIEEFHVGFECENRLKSIFTKDQMSWEKFTCSTPNVLYSLLMDLKQNDTETRIKYLDKEDIESLGFESYFDPKENMIYAHMMDNNPRKEEIYIDYNPMNHSLKIHNIDDLLFNFGWIKNKSELKVLLKQLNILT